MDQFMAVRMEIATTMLRLFTFIEWVGEREDVDESLAGFLAASLYTTIINAHIAVQIINHPTVVRPIAPRRCIFY